jgi:hypothetical protein
MDAEAEHRSETPATALASYAVAWQREAGPRLVGSATVESDGLMLVGREAGARDGVEQLLLSGADVEHVELRRSSALPAVSVEHDGRSVVIELLMEGWGAAHHLADTLGRPLTPAASERVPMVAIVARILPCP